MMFGAVSKIGVDLSVSMKRRCWVCSFRGDATIFPFGENAYHAGFGDGHDFPLNKRKLLK